MSDVKDLSTLGQDKDKQILDLKLPMPSEKFLTTKEFNEFSVYNFDRVGKVLLGILDFLKGQHNVNEVYKQRIGKLEEVLDTWIEEAQKLEETKKDL